MEQRLQQLRKEIYDTAPGEDAQRADWLYWMSQSLEKLDAIIDNPAATLQPSPTKAGDRPTVTDYEEVFQDHRRLVRELDVLLNGVNAAEQASLCDIVAQLRSEKRPAKAEQEGPWVKAADRIPSISDGITKLKIDGKDAEGVWSATERAFIVGGHRYPPTIYFIEWLDEKKMRQQ